jgi:DNA-binding MarR family transcriptional regulator
MPGGIPKFAEVDRLIHEPARLIVVAILYSTEAADFLYLLRETGLTKGNLSAHITKLEEAGYVEVEKTYGGARGKTPRTILRLNDAGRAAFRGYRARLRQTVDALPE